MKRLYLIITGCFCFSTGLFCQDIDYAKDVIRTLSSPEYKGRGYVEEGIGKAAEYIADEFKNGGLVPVFNKYFQDFFIPVNTFPGKMSLEIDGKTLVPGVDFIVDPASKGIEGEFSASIINNSELSKVSVLNRVLKKSEGKFLVIDNRNSDALNEETRKLTSELLKILKREERLKIAGVIELSDKELMWSVSGEEAARTHIIIKSDVESIEKINLSIENEFRNFYKVSNIAGFIEGTSVPDTFIVLTAHYDHLGKMGNDCYFPGANDNASGTAMILNMARYFKQNPPRYSVLFLALASEEAGLLGADYFVKHSPFNLNKIKFLLNFDLAGTGEEGITVVNATVFKDKFELLQSINSEFNLLPQIKSRGEACNSDHCLFYENEVPCFYSYTMGGSKAYHDIYDTFDNLSMAEFQDYSQLVIKFIENIR